MNNRSRYTSSVRDRGTDYRYGHRNNTQSYNPNQWGFTEPQQRKNRVYRDDYYDHDGYYRPNYRRGFYDTDYRYRGYDKPNDYREKCYDRCYNDPYDKN